MANGLTRRNFMQASGAATGTLIATGWSPFSFAQNEKVRIALIGTGTQNRIHIEDGIAGTPDLEIVAMADVLKYSLGNAWTTAGGNEELLKHLYFDYHEMLDKEKDNIDAVVIATPYKTHHPIVMDCLDAGKYVFCEKTMSHTYESCREIVTKCHETGKFVQVGHQRRYNPEYIYAVSEFVNGRLGRINFIEAQWHRNGDWRRPLPTTKDGKPIQLTPPEQALIKDLQRLVNWRVYEEYSAGLMSELATHHLEVINWMLGAMPSRVYASGGIDFWRDDRDTFDNVTLIYEYRITPDKRGFQIVDGPSDLCDPRRVNRTYTTRVTWSGSLQSNYKGESILAVGNLAAFELRERISDKGVVDMEAKGCRLHPEAKRIWLDPKTMQPTEDEKIIAWIKSSGNSQFYSKWIEQPSVSVKDVIDPKLYELSHDVRQFRAFAHHIKNGGKPRTNEMCGMLASVCDIAGHEAMVTGEPVDIDPAIWKFDFETPDPFELGELA